MMKAIFAIARLSGVLPVATRNDVSVRMFAVLEHGERVMRVCIDGERGNVVLDLDEAAAMEFAAQAHECVARLAAMGANVIRPEFGRKKPEEHPA